MSMIPIAPSSPINHHQAPAVETNIWRSVPGYVRALRFTNTSSPFSRPFSTRRRLNFTSVLSLLSSVGISPILPAAFARGSIDSDDGLGLADDECAAELSLGKPRALGVLWSARQERRQSKHALGTWVFQGTTREYASKMRVATSSSYARLGLYVCKA
jgi:hypothetical protein